MLPQRSRPTFPRATVLVHARLHGKVLVAASRGVIVATLVGSHNITHAALTANVECGVLILAGESEALRRVAAGLHDWTTMVIREAAPVRCGLRPGGAVVRSGAEPRQR